MNLRKALAIIESYGAESGLEQFALDTIRSMFPILQPTDATGLEGRALQRSYDILVPDMDFDDSEDYLEHVASSGWGDSDQRRLVAGQFDALVAAVDASGILHYP
jgi:hypothetical protein